jgi:hypothetical protein
MGANGIDPAGIPWAALKGDARRKYLWHWSPAEIGDLAQELILELEERGVLIEVVVPAWARGVLSRERDRD